MRNVLNAVREEFDMVVVDAPPIVAVTDAAVLCPLVDGVLLTVAEEKFRSLHSMPGPC